MKWYYAEKKDAIGPLSEQEFQSLVQTGKITLSTLVWRQGMKNWQPYNQAVSPEQHATAEAALPDRREPSPCSQCGSAYPKENMVPHGDGWVCAACEPLFVQKSTDSVAVTGALLHYAGFWVRLGAKIIDLSILLAVCYVFIYSAKTVLTHHGVTLEAAPMQIFLGLVEFLLATLYTTWFLGTYGATPGKMAFNLLVVTPTGGNIGYLRALSRHLAEMLSRITLLLGYVIAAFDSEKQTLHDRICSTRVIRPK